jgi:hypothetical protein
VLAHDHGLLDLLSAEGALLHWVVLRGVAGGGYSTSVFTCEQGRMVRSGQCPWRRPWLQTCGRAGEVTVRRRSPEGWA